MAINLEEFVFEEDLALETEQMKQNLQKVQAENRFNKLKQSTKHLSIKELEKQNVNGKLDQLIVDRKADEKAQDMLSDRLAEQKVNQVTGTTKLQRDTFQETEKNLSKGLSDLKTEQIGEKVEPKPQINLNEFVFEDEIPEPEPERKDLLTAPVETIARSGKEFAEGIISAVTHPVQTAKSIYSLARGTIEKLIPGEQENEKTVDALVDFYKERYGGLENIKETALTDPVGFAVDLSMVLGLGGGAIAKVGKVAKIGKVARAGAKAAKAAQFVDPLALTMKGAGKTLSAVSKKIKLAPFAKKVDPKVVQAAEKLGVKIPASAKTEGKIAPLAETLVSKGFFGNRLDRMVESAKNLLVKKADDIVKETGKSPDLTSAGIDIFKGAENYRNNFMKVKNTLYDNALTVEKGGSKVIVKPSKSLNFAKTIFEEKGKAAELLGKSKDIKFYKKLVEKLEDAKGVDGKVYKAAIKELNEKMSNFADPFVAGNRGAMKKMVTLLSNELDDAILAQRPDFSLALEKANKFYSDGINKINSAFGKKIFKLKDQPDKILPAIINKNTSSDDIARIYEVIGKENIPSVQSAFLENMFNKAKNTEGVLTPTGISRQIKSFGETKLSKVLTKKQLQTVDNIKEISKSLGKYDKISKGSQTAFLLRVLSEAATFTTNPILGLKLIGGDFLLSRFVTSPFGQKILAEGFQGTGKLGEALAKVKTPTKVARVARIKKAVEE